MDTLRQDWLSDERFTSVDVMVAEDTSVIIAVKTADRYIDVGAWRGHRRLGRLRSACWPCGEPGRARRFAS